MPADPTASFPEVSIVIPSFNQGRFLPRALDSVLAQDFPAIEILVIDGGSSDDSRAILGVYGERYRDRLRWVSEPDRGQSDALNKGFRRARGAIVAWLNSDDAYAPDAVSRAFAALTAHPEVGLVYGRGQILDSVDKVVGPFLGCERFCLWRLVHGLDFILQPSTFFRRAALESVGFVDPDLHYAMDWDLWIKLAAVTEVLWLDADLAFSREYASTKTQSGGWPRLRELRRVVRRHAGRSWTPGLKLYAFDTLNRDFGRRLPRVLRPFLERSVTRAMRSVQEHMQVYADGWLGPRGALLLPRRWGRARVEFEALLVPPGTHAVQLVAEGQLLSCWSVSAPGPYVAEFAVPAGASPLAEIRVLSSFSFRPDPASGDRRQLSLLCRQVARAASA